MIEPTPMLVIHCIINSVDIALYLQFSKISKKFDLIY